MHRLFLLALLLTATGAQAQDCVPAKLLATVPLHSAEPDSNIRTVPVTLNGATRDMILDTGGAITQVSRSVIAELGLPLRRSSAAVYDVSGRVSRHYTKVKAFGFGALARPDAALLVWPEEKRPYAGEIAQDMLQPYDVDVDFAAGVLKMYAKGPKKGQCPGPTGWTPTARTEMRNKGWHLHVPVSVDGHSYDAIFDTGSSHSIMRLPVARRDFGLEPGSAGMTPFPAVNGDNFLNGHLRRFTNMSLGGMSIENPEILIVPDVMNRKADRSPLADNRSLHHNAGLVLPDLSLGMDVLKHLHLYISFGEQALYVAPAGTSALPKP